MRLPKCYGLVGAFVLLLAMPVVAHAEPGASMSHLPFLWILAAGVSAWLAWTAVKFIGRGGRLQTPAKKWSVLAILFIILLVFLSPVFVGIGSILITGRTM